MDNKVDIVYILGKGSLWSNNEIKHSLRSVDRFLKNKNRVFIIGELPSFVRNVIHIPCDDAFDGHEKNITNKILKACNTTEISSNFLLFNDDHFLLKEVEANKFPYLYKEDLAVTIESRKRDDEYKEALKNTYQLLKSKKVSTKNFDGHIPILYNKDTFRKIFNDIDWKNKEYVIKSVYCNINKILGNLSADCKINKRDISLVDVEEIIKDKLCFSIGDEAVRDNAAIRKMSNTKLLIKNLYKEPSQYECY